MEGVGDREAHIMIDPTCAERFARMGSTLSDDYDPRVTALVCDWWASDRPLTISPAAHWIGKFRSLGGFVVGDRVNESARPVSAVRLYRAARQGDEHGMSWSPFRVAAWAYGELLGCPLWTTLAEPEHVLGVLPGPWGGAWEEFVCDPAGVRPDRWARTPGSTTYPGRQADLLALRDGLPAPLMFGDRLPPMN